MGMDVHGLNPVIRKEPTSEILEKDWTKLSEDNLGKYFEAKQQHEEDNPGIYFRNNVWWRRPVWEYVWKLCGECDEDNSFALAADRIITQEQYEEGHANSGAEINAHQAELIALRLNHAIKMGWVKEYKEQYDVDTADDEFEYPFDVDNVKAFANFCKDSGGFQIC